VPCAQSQHRWSLFWNFDEVKCSAAAVEVGPAAKGPQVLSVLTAIKRRKLVVGRQFKFLWAKALEV